jgi:hypothetical protein
MCRNPRFCNNTLDDWKANLTPKDLAPEVSKVQPIMVVYFEGQIHRIPVKQGPDGLQEFQTQIRELFRWERQCAGGAGLMVRVCVCVCARAHARVHVRVHTHALTHTTHTLSGAREHHPHLLAPPLTPNPAGCPRTSTYP